MSRRTRRKLKALLVASTHYVESGADQFGRQIMLYGDRRVFAPAEWGNVGNYWWDAAKLYYDTDSIEVDEALRQDIQQFVPNSDLHHVHVWELRANQRILTAHLRVPDVPLSKLEIVLQQVRGRLHTRWAISHTTLEPEIVGCGDTDLLGNPVAVSAEQADKGARTL